MKLTHLAWLVAIVWTAVGCNQDRQRRQHQLDAGTFRQILQCGAPDRHGDAACSSLRDEAKRIESIRIEPRGPSSARYVITWRDRGTRDVVDAEYPGKVTDEITAAGIMYDVQ